MNSKLTPKCSNSGNSPEFPRTLTKLLLKHESLLLGCCGFNEAVDWRHSKTWHFFGKTRWLLIRVSCQGLFEKKNCTFSGNGSRCSVQFSLLVVRVTLLVGQPSLWNYKMITFSILRCQLQMYQSNGDCVFCANIQEILYQVRRPVFLRNFRYYLRVQS